MITDREVLIKAIDRALKNGLNMNIIDTGTFYQAYFMIKGKDDKRVYASDFNPKDCYGLFFSHEFAKAFWAPNGVNIWKEHLQKMVQEENPIDYLRIFI